MPDAQPYEILSVEDKEQFPTQHGTTLQAMQWSVKSKDGTVLSLGVNRRPSNPPPNVGETVWLETWENENGFMKGKRTQGPRQVKYSSDGGGGDSSRESAIVRQHSQHMAVLYAAAVGENDLTKIEAWTDHFDADVQRASGAAQGSRSGPDATGHGDTSPRNDGAAPHPGSPQVSNGGEPKITDKQIGLVLARQKMHSISNDDMARLVALFHIEKLKDLPRGSVDDFLTAMVNPIPTGQSDVPAEPEPVASPADDELPF